MWATVPGPRQKQNRKHCGPQSMCWHALGSTLQRRALVIHPPSFLQAVRALSTVYGASYGRPSSQSATSRSRYRFLAMMSRVWLLEGAKGLV